ncbi:DNA-binding FadR family transcriptional regulator [Microbacterium ginsengiterrae]|uniref:DNA-binding FadR family transcriptional regulator n=1 Tax=Microbacterium ginsengiterrae TaxID=546115 RepID=A0A7W9FAG7_9MICO|nr:MULTISPECIES: FadR/GntR family transcriptional regulator [Microbacterium]MBB5742107.1 DNA-binding FadR family transcriptional regulator [Microbacterium ginsengiterrae]
MKSERVTRTQSVVDGLLDEIIAGRVVAGEPLPAEADLAALLGVSRLTLREGVRLLQAQGVIVPVPGSRHRVAPVDEWTGLEAVVRYSRSGGARRRSSLELLDMRVMFETGAAELAAPRCTDEHIARLAELLEQMRTAHANGDVPGFVDADLAFHDVIFAAADNRILVASVRPLTTMLQASRSETSAVLEIREHALVEHAAVLEAMRSRSPEAAREAMAGHMRQTRDDLLHYVLGE